MSANSRRKGASAELEWAELMRKHGIHAERTGRNGKTSEDVTHAIDGVHIEVKRRERYDLDSWISQAERDAGESVPWVVFRKSRQPWRVVVPAEWLLDLIAVRGDG